MSVMPGELLSFDDLQRMHENDVDLDDDGVDDGERNPDIDDDNLSSISVADVPDLDIFGQFADGPSDEVALEATNQEVQNEVDFVAAPPDLPPLVIHQETVNNDDENGSPPIPKSRSKAHHYIDNGKAIFLSLDVETGGEYCGVLQLSAEICRMTILPQGASKTKDKASHIKREPLTFNEYVYPGEGAIYSQACTNIHGLSESSQCIKDASDINVVWSRFVGWINNNTARDEVIILVAYNGETCDMKWLWKLT